MLFTRSVSRDGSSQHPAPGLIASGAWQGARPHALPSITTARFPALCQYFPQQLEAMVPLPRSRSLAKASGAGELPHLLPGPAGRCSIVPWRAIGVLALSTIVLSCIWVL